MTTIDHASWARRGFDPRRGLRLAVALLVATALHAALILGIELPAPGSSTGAQALEIRLTPARISHQLPAADDEAQSAPIPEESAISDADTGHRAARETAPAADIAPTVVATPEPATGNNSLDYSALAKEIANAHARREQSATVEAGGIRTKRITSSSATSSEEAAYLDMWQKKIERIGRANYPPGGLSGELLVLAVIRRDGALLDARVLESSRHPALDAAALRTVRLAAPFSHFPTEMRKSYDRLEIVHRWRFAREGALLQ